ncbi:MAG: Zn-dependent hydrolase [Zavarzinia sp.]|nr:Zn-dependent hydrolase [Zavarzinia sp.]
MSSAEAPLPMFRPRPEDKAELHRLFDEINRPGATARGGLHRLSASAEDGAARQVLCDWLAARGVDVRVDPVGNVFGVIEWRKGAPVVLCGSHLDSQPTGGRYDGAYGVVCAALAQQAVAQAVAGAGITPAFNLAMVNWTNEEGARFVPSLLGSSVFIGALDAEDALAVRDEAGISLGEALSRIGFKGTRGLDLDVAGYAEVHVEQGRGLESSGTRIGVVRGTWAALKLRVRLKGDQAHTGPTPMKDRRDALLAAAHVIAEVRAIADGEPAGVMHSSVGRLHVYPNSANVVPSDVTAYVEFRSRQPEVLDRAERRFAASLNRFAAMTGTSFEIEDRSLRAPAGLDPALGDLAHEVAAGVGLASADVDTVSGHDAISLSQVTPTVLLFVPSAGGIAHNEGEYTSPEDLEAGLEVMAGVIGRMCLAGAVLEDEGAAA